MIYNNTLNTNANEDGSFADRVVHLGNHVSAIERPVKLRQHLKIL